MSIFHKSKGQPYHIEDSLRGIRFAARHGWDEIDLDLNMTKDGIIVVTHWLRPMEHDGFIDPQHLLDRNRTVPSMTLAEVQRLRTRDDYRIQTLNRALQECGERRIGARLEPKADKRFENVEVWRPVKATANMLGVKVKGYSIRNLGGRGAGVRRVAAMRAAGIHSVVIR